MSENEEIIVFEYSRGATYSADWNVLRSVLLQNQVSFSLINRLPFSDYIEIKLAYNAQFRCTVWNSIALQYIAEIRLYRIYGYDFTNPLFNINNHAICYCGWMQ